MRYFTMIGAAVLVLAAPAVQAAEAVVATFPGAAIKRTKVIAGGAVFLCEQAQCVANAPNDRTLTLEACKVLSKRFGRVESFGAGNRSLASEKLQACQAAAK
jgi:hypothetical protein